jgi:hypothetical protein
MKQKAPNCCSCRVRENLIDTDLLTKFLVFQLMRNTLLNYEKVVNRKSRTATCYSGGQSGDNVIAPGGSSLPGMLLKSNIVMRVFETLIVK